jgi:act minimal PKS acyl carrier protein
VQQLASSAIPGGFEQPVERSVPSDPDDHGPRAERDLSEQIGVAELKDILREAAGEDEEVDLDGDVLDTDLADLGYDSLALLEAAAVASRRYGLKLSDDELETVTTPRELLARIQAGLDARAGA